MAQTKAVSIFTTPSCHFCHAAKELFQENGIEYSEYNVMEDMEKRKEMVEKTGQLGVPVITIGDNVMVGYDEEKVRSLLGI